MAMTRRHFLASAAALAASPAAAGIRTPLHPLGAGSPALPYKKRLEYLYCDSDCWWNTSVENPGGLHRQVEAAVMLTGASLPSARTLCYLGTKGFSAANRAMISTLADPPTWFISSDFRGTPLARNHKYTLRSEALTWFLDGAPVATSADFVCTYPVIIFAMNPIGSANAMHASRLYYFKEWTEGALSVDAFPVLLRDGTPALWDAVRGAPIPNLGTGTPAFP